MKTLSQMTYVEFERVLISEFNSDIIAMANNYNLTLQELIFKAAIKADLNKEYNDLLIRLRYAKDFTPHKVQYYEDRITEIITRQS